MIENPQVGQRVWWIPEGGPLERRLGKCYGGGHWTLDTGVPVDSSEIYFTPQSAAAALRAEAQRLMDAADKLESETVDDSVCYCGDLMRDHKAYGSCTSPRVMEEPNAD